MICFRELAKPACVDLEGIAEPLITRATCGLDQRIDMFIEQALFLLEQNLRAQMRRDRKRLERVLMRGDDETATAHNQPRAVVLLRCKNDIVPIA